MPTYSVIRRDRDYGRRGGGATKFVKKSLRFNIVAIPTIFNELEVCAIDALLVKGFKIRFVSLYRPPGLTNESTSLLCDCLAHLASVVYDVCVLGDFNCGDVDWSYNL